MKKFMRQFRHGEKGFTLIELLIVIAIIGVLAAVVLPNVTGLIGRGQTEAGQAELVTIQTAVDTMMANEGLTTVTATTDTSAMSAFPTGNPIYPNYLRTATSSRSYSVSANGTITVAP